MKTTSRIKVTTENVSIRELLRRTESNLGTEDEISIPDFQRKSGQWNWTKQNEFILDVLRSQTPFIQPIVVGIVKGLNQSLLIDGYQRISTLHDFVRGIFSIRLGPDTFSTYDELSIEEKRNFSNQRFTLSCVSDIDTVDTALLYFKSINSGIPLTKFQKNKGHKEISYLCKLISNSADIKDIALTLKLALSLKAFNKKNNKNIIDQMIISSICLAQDPSKYSHTKTMASQWENYITDDGGVLNEYASKYLDEKLWYKFSKIVSSLKCDINVGLSSSESRLAFLMVLFSLGIEKSVNVKRDLELSVDDGTFSYNLIMSREGKVNAAKSREDLFNRAMNCIEKLRRKGRRGFTRAEISLKLLEQGDKCAICQCEIPDQSLSCGDHIIPYSKEGETSIENLQVLCAVCNKEKTNNII